MSTLYSWHMFIMVRVLALLLLYSLYLNLVEGQWEGDFGSTIVGSDRNRNSGSPGDLGDGEFGAPALFSSNYQGSTGKVISTPTPQLDCNKIIQECQCYGPNPPGPTPKGGGGGKGKHPPHQFQPSGEPADYPTNYFG